MNSHAVDTHAYSHEVQSRPGFSRRGFLTESTKAFGLAALASVGLKGNAFAEEKSKTPVKIPEKMKPMTADELRDLLPTRIHFEKLGKVLERGCPCVDGRNGNDKGVAGTPGGDAGVDVAALSALESLDGKALTYDQVSHIVRNVPGMKYFHTAEDALTGQDGERGLFHAIVDDSLLSRYASDHSGAMKLIREGIPSDAKAQARLGSILREGKWQGCGHLQSAIFHSDAYEVRSELVKDVIRASFERMWLRDSRKSAFIDPLPGAHEERAVVEVRMKGKELGMDHDIALVQPNGKDGGQVFVLHNQIAEPRIRQVGKVIQDMRAGFDIEKFVKAAVAKDGTQAGQTAHRLAAGKPHLVVSVNQDRSWEVADAGKIA